MERRGKIVADQKRRQLVEKFQEKRPALLKVMRDQNQSDEARAAAFRQFSKIPLNASKVRMHNRCAVTGRSKDFYRKFGLSRITLRQLALEGNLPGVRKASL